MDVPDSTSEATISEALDSRPADITSEARIQEALDYRRSQSSRNSSFSRPLSAEDEDELEGKAGDSGSARTSCIGDEIHDLDVLSIYQNSGAADPAGSKEAGMKAAPLDTHGASISRSLSSLRTVEQGPNLIPTQLEYLKSSRISVTHKGCYRIVLDLEKYSLIFALSSPHVLITDFETFLPATSTSGTLHKSLEVISILAHLTTFGILGVLVRYSLQVLFGPNVAKLTSNTSALFIDLPANMLGSFFMGWVGVVFKKDIAVFSEHLAVGLSTGLMGSITTYAAMMQTNLANMVTGSWVTGLFGLLIGVYLAQMSLVVGRDTARLLHRIIQLINDERRRKGLEKWQMPSPDNFHRRMVSLVLFVFLGGGLWVAAVILAVLDTSSFSRRTLWVACCFAAPGVWIRWHFARLNGRGVGPKHYQRWFPVGTFLVNVTASSLEAGLISVNSAVGTYTATLIVNGVNLGALGCLSTISTFVAEIQIMHEGPNQWRSYAYPLISMTVSLVIGILIYGVPIWSKAL